MLFTRVDYIFILNPFFSPVKFYFGEKWKKNDIKNKIRKINLNVIFLPEQQKYKSITLIMLEK